MKIRPLRPDDREEWLRLRIALWPDSTREDLALEQKWLLEDPALLRVIVAERPGGGLAGFVEVSLREWAEGCTSHPVGYLEAWYVDPADRRRGLGRKLAIAAEHWVASRGCTEIASDADAANEISHAAHWALGYDD